MVKSDNHYPVRQPTEVSDALDELADLIMAATADEARLSALAAHITALDMQELGISVPAPELMPYG